MFRNIAYKEWLKCRYALAFICLAALIQIIYLFVGLNKSFRFAGHEHIWDVIVNRNVFLLSGLTYFPLTAAIILGVVQFVPEIIQKRIKLSLHLPLPEKTIIKNMLLFSQVILLLIFAIHLLIISLSLSIYFPVEIVMSTIYTLLPWYLSAFVALAFIPTICFEPILLRQIFLVFLCMAILKVFYISSFPGAYKYSFVYCLIICILTTPFAYVSIDRFKRGINN